MAKLVIRCEVCDRPIPYDPPIEMHTPIWFVEGHNKCEDCSSMGKNEFCNNRVLKGINFPDSHPFGNVPIVAVELK